jgi:hypothetical protein
MTGAGPVRGGANLPGTDEINTNQACQITAAELSSQYNVKPDDGADDSAGLQAITVDKPLEFDVPVNSTSDGSATMTKQLSTNGPYENFYPDKQRIYQFGWNGTAYKHLDIGGTPIADWAKNEQRDYTGGHGVDATKTDSAQSLFLKSVTRSAAAADLEAAVTVSTSDQLKAALASATPGTTINLAAGTYRGSFATQRAGTASQPITLTGPANAVLINDGPSGSAPSCPAPTAGWDSGYGLWLYGAPYWNLKGFTVAESKKGIVVDNSHHTTIDGVNVHHVDEEAVHFRRSSADSVIRDSTITDTGLVQKGYGEGVYIGSANSNWSCHGNSGGHHRSELRGLVDRRQGNRVPDRGQHRNLYQPRHVRQRLRDAQSEHQPVVSERLREHLAQQQVGSRRGGAVRHQDHLHLEMQGQSERGVRVEHGQPGQERPDQRAGHTVIAE